MLDRRAFYIDGTWVAPSEVRDFDVLNPATEQPVAVISLASEADVDRAVQSAREAFEMWSETSVSERADMLRRALKIYLRRRDEIAEGERLGEVRLHSGRLATLDVVGIGIGRDRDNR